MAGPFNTSPVSLNSLPWQGHLNIFPATFNVHPKCVHFIFKTLYLLSILVIAIC